MEDTIIDCTQIHSREDLHRIFREALGFPACYGSNLDALYDCLTEISGTVRLLDWPAAQIRLGAYGTKAKKVLAAAALHNTNLDLHI